MAVLTLWYCLLGPGQAASIIRSQIIFTKFLFPANVWVYLPVNPLCQLLPSEAPKRMIGRLPYVPWHGFMILYTLLLWGYCRIRLHVSNSWSLWTKSWVKEKSRVSCRLEVKEQTSPWAMMVQTSRPKKPHIPSSGKTEGLGASPVNRYVWLLASLSSSNADGMPTTWVRDQVKV